MFSEQFKTLTSSNYYRIEYILLKFFTRFTLTNIYKRVFRNFSVSLDLDLFEKIKTGLVSTHPQKPNRNSCVSLYITQDLKKIKKNPEHPFVDISKVNESQYR